MSNLHSDFNVDNLPIKKKTVTSAARIVIFVIIALLIGKGVFVIIPAGYKGVKFNSITGLSEHVYSEGIAFKIPFIEYVYPFDVRVQKVEGSESSVSKDLQSVTTSIVLNYRPLSDQVVNIYQNIGMEYELRVIQPAIKESLRAVMAKFNAENLVTNRALVSEALREMLQSKLEQFNIQVTAVSITDFQFSAEFDSAIEAKQTAEQLALKAMRDLDRIKTEAEQRIAEAEGKAEAIRLEGEVLRTNPQVLQMRAIEKWNGTMPQVIGGDGTLPMINLRP